MDDLTKKHCTACKEGTPPLSDEEEDKFKVQASDWSLIRDPSASSGQAVHRIRKQLKFKDFMSAIDFVNRVAKIAEEEGHHPDIYIYYNKVALELYTHAAGGLHENDFIMAAKINSIKS